jgi:metal-responsive CopG/Arc/MetJ family transcriptional regulator
MKLLSEFTIKLDSELLRQVNGVAEAEGISRSEYVRDLLMIDIQKRRRKHAVMNSVFTQPLENPQPLSGVIECSNGGSNE